MKWPAVGGPFQWLESHGALGPRGSPSISKELVSAAGSPWARLLSEVKSSGIRAKGMTRMTRPLMGSQEMGV